MECIQCNTKWDDHKNMVAAITLDRMGNEHSYTYWLCPECDVYTQMWFVDHFLGSDDTMTPVMLDRKKGDALVARIKTCSDPDRKSCRCDVHQKFPG